MIYRVRLSVSFRDVRNYSFFSTQAPIVLIGSENTNHVFDVRLKEPYDENLKRLNEFADKTFPNVSLAFQFCRRYDKGYIQECISFP